MSEFMRISGLHLEEVNGSRVRGSIEFGDHHHTPWGVVHGGVYSAAVESAASMGASAAVEERGQFAVGVSNNTDFLRPMKEGRVDVVAEPIIQGQIQQLWQVIITRSADGKEVARGQVRLQNIPMPSVRLASTIPTLRSRGGWRASRMPQVLTYGIGRRRRFEACRWCRSPPGCLSTS